MIVGIGVDVVEVQRFRAIADRTAGFTERVLTHTEIHHRDGSRRSDSSLAARFAAKEAVAKALGAPAGLEWHHCVVSVDTAGRPSLDLSDTVEVDDAPVSSLSVSGPFADGVPTDGSNLVMKALGLAGRTARVHVTKNIPNGGGLGGGSADAAAARVGADIAFCMVGGRARVTGIGEIVEPLAHEPRAVTLVIPPLHVSTPAVYRTWDRLGGPTTHPVNHLTEAAIATEPGLAVWQERIRQASGQEPMLAGSGATWFLHGHHDGIAAALAGATVITTNTRPA